MTATSVDCLIRGTVLTMDGARRIIGDGAVAVAEGRIAAVGRRADVENQYRADTVLGGPQHYVIPGLIDCHNHLAQSLIRDYALDDLPGIFRIFIAAERAMSRDEVEVAARVTIAQLLRSGVTTVAETTSTADHETIVADAIMETGMRCAMARGQGDRKTRLVGNFDQADDRSSFSDDPGRLAEDLDRCAEFIATWQTRGEGRLRPWIHAGSISRSSERRLLRTRELAERNGSGVMIHINRDREEVELSLALHGVRPIEHLHRIGALWPGLLAIHAMLSTEREIALMAGSGAKVAHAPLSCVDLLSAVTRVTAMRAAGVTVGLGCDTIVNDLFKVMNVAALMHVQASGIPLFDPAACTAEDTFAMATSEAARALRWEEAIGSLEVGKRADIAVVAGANLRLSPAENPYAALVRYAVSTDVESVLVDGRLLVDRGRLLTLDEAALEREARRVHRRLGEVLKPRRYRPLLASEPLQGASPPSGAAAAGTRKAT